MSPLFKDCVDGVNAIHTILTVGFQSNNNLHLELEYYKF